LTQGACAYDAASTSYIDFGNTDGYAMCGANGPVASTYMPVKSFFTVDVRAMYINGVKATLPSVFQTTGGGLSGFDIKTWSVLDSCTNRILIPYSVFSALYTAIIASNGLPNWLQSTDKSNFVNGYIAFYTSSSDFSWNLLPSFAIEITSDQVISPGVNETFQLVLGPKQYIQVDQDGYCNRY
jgi:hypothetical protein